MVKIWETSSNWNNQNKWLLRVPGNSHHASWESKGTAREIEKNTTWYPKHPRIKMATFQLDDASQIITMQKWMFTWVEITMSSRFFRWLSHIFSKTTSAGLSSLDSPSRVKPPGTPKPTMFNGWRFGGNGDYQPFFHKELGFPSSNWNKHFINGCLEYQPPARLFFVRFFVCQSFSTVLTLHKTNSSPLKIGRNPKGNSSSNHPFVSFREGT